MSISYQNKLIELVEYASRRDCLFTQSYQGFYIHSGVYNGVTVFRVDLTECETFYSKSLAGIKARIRQYGLKFPQVIC
jgi:hypothetical protein